MKARRLKISYKHHGRDYKRYPAIRFSGKYLSAFDFKVGDTVEVKLEAGRIEILKVNMEGQSA